VLLASAVVYGLAFSTVLTLLLTPVLLAAPAVLRRRLPGFAARAKRLAARAAGRARRTEAASAPLPAPAAHRRAAE
jgi:multidrug efflux pump